MDFIKVVCGDGGIWFVQWPVIRRCALLMDRMEDCAVNRRAYPEIELARMKTRKMLKIMKWANYDHEHPHEDTDELQTWHANYLNMSHGSLLKLWQGAVYIKAPRLVQLIDQFVRCIVLGTPLDTLKPLKIQLNLTAAQRKQLIDDGATVESIKQFCVQHGPNQQSNANEDNESSE
ncbi:uncharacterized protein LOC117901362 [Drosophila subobscura]|uniref:uncharacterized protein LOC117901362 n=1 Tax=Drosophila subobscura TaxID=7241 RepID=UPI00155A0E85|nr:uncharacterized protein LOC117901362 [Drosophila subobscura]